MRLKTRKNFAKSTLKRLEKILQKVHLKDSKKFCKKYT